MNEKVYQLEDLFNDYYETSDMINKEYLKNFARIVRYKYEEDIDKISKYVCLQERKMIKDMVKTKMVHLLGVTSNSFSKLAADENVLNKEIDDNRKCRYVFDRYSNSLKDFGYILDLCQENTELMSDQKFLRTIYSMYSTMITALLFDMPKEYRDDLMKQFNFIYLEGKKALENADADVNDFYCNLHYFKDFAILYLHNKFNIDIYEEDEDKKLTRNK